MHIHIDTHPDVSTRLQSSMHRQLKYKLASYADSVERVHASLVADVDHNNQSRYTCTVTATMHDGTDTAATTKGSAPNICIADAASRLARTVSRQYKFANLGWPGESAG